MESNNNTEEIPDQMNDYKLEFSTIPFDHRKSPILSITFRSLDLEYGQFRLKLETDGDADPKIEAYSNLTEMTLVRIIIFYILFRFLNFN